MEVMNHPVNHLLTIHYFRRAGLAYTLCNTNLINDGGPETATVTASAENFFTNSRFREFGRRKKGAFR
jgi:hypothetical protein